MDLRNARDVVYYVLRDEEAEFQLVEGKSHEIFSHKGAKAQRKNETCLFWKDKYWTSDRRTNPNLPDSPCPIPLFLSMKNNGQV